MQVGRGLYAPLIVEEADPIRVDREVINRRFRRYVQVLNKGSVRTYFKEFGDSRCLSQKSGKF